MKIVKPTFESLLAETNCIFVRFENINGIKALVAGGIGKNGKWFEFSLLLPKNTSFNDIANSLTVVEYFTREEGKRWHVENIYYSLIREMCMNLN